MSARSIASITLSFGLVSIPLKVYSATEPNKTLGFNMLCKESNSRLKQQYVRVTDGAVVARENMVKGYEFAKDQYVTFTPEELKAMEDAGSTIAEIAEFVPVASVDPVFFDKAYYLAPDKGGAKPYALVAGAMRASQRVAIAKWGSRGRQHVVMIRADDSGALVMQQLLYADEVRSASELDIPGADVKEAELKLAMQLIDAQAVEAFDPTKYRDEVRSRIEAAIAAKVEGNVFTITEPKREAQVIDLMAALAASLEAAPKSKAKAKPAASTTKKKAA